MNATLAALLMGASVGLSIAAPIGPTSMMCIERTLAAGITRGVAAGFGVATVHLIYGALAISGGIGLAQAVLCTTLVPFASGLLLLWFAVRILRRSTVLAVAHGGRRTLASSYCGAVSFGFLNPATPVLFAAATPTLIGGEAASQAPFLISGVFLGSLVWWCALSGGIWLLRSRLTDRGLDLMNKAAGLVLVGLAATMFFRAWNG